MKATYPKQSDLKVAEKAQLEAMEVIDELAEKMTQNQRLEFYRTLIETLTLEAEASEARVS